MKFKNKKTGEVVDFSPTLVNSSLVSAQNRQRYYWANWEFGQPEDKGIVLADILEDDGEYNPAAIRGRYLLDGKRQDGKMLTAGLTQQMLEVRSDNKTNALTTVQKDTVVSSLPPGRYPVKLRDKSKCVRSSGRGSYDRHEWDSISNCHYRKLTPLECERLQTFSDNWTLIVDENGKQLVSNSQRYKALGNAWTVDVIAHIFGHLK